MSPGGATGDASPASGVASDGLAAADGAAVDPAGRRPPAIEPQGVRYGWPLAADAWDARMMFFVAQSGPRS